MVCPPPSSNKDLVLPFVVVLLISVDIYTIVESGGGPGPAHGASIYNIGSFWLLSLLALLNLIKFELMAYYLLYSIGAFASLNLLSPSNAEGPTRGIV